MKKYICTICGFIYDEAQGIPESGIAPGTKREDLADDWTCPLCNVLKENFEAQGENSKTAEIVIDENNEELDGLLNAEMSALFSSLAKGARKQYLEEESELFTKLSDYYTKKTLAVAESCFNHIMLNIERDLNDTYPNANAIAKSKGDRGAQRALLWTEKVTKIVSSLLSRYEKQGDAMLEGKKVDVCDICGFIYIGNELADTETGQIDALTCNGCVVCAKACPLGAISMIPKAYPPQQKKSNAVINELFELAQSKTTQEKAALQIIAGTGSPIKKQLATAVAKSNRIMAEDVIREAGYMIPQSANVNRLLTSLLEDLPADFPIDILERLLELIKPNEKSE